MDKAKILVAYYSRGGNTEAMAKKVAEGAEAEQRGPKRFIGYKEPVQVGDDELLQGAVTVDTVDRTAHVIEDSAHRDSCETRVVASLHPVHEGWHDHLALAQPGIEVSTKPLLPHRLHDVPVRSRQDPYMYWLG